MTNPNDGWTVVSDPGELHAYAAANLPSAPNGRRAKAPAVPPSGDMLETSKDRDTARNAMDLIGRIQPQLDRVRGLYQRQLAGAGPVQSLREYLPSQGNSQFDAAVAGLRTLVRPATRTPGEGSMSDFESKLALQGVPSRYSWDGANEEALGNLQRFLDTSKASYSKRLGLPVAPPVSRKAAAATHEITLDRNGNVVR